MIITEDDIKREQQAVRCKMAIEEYFKAKQVTIDRRSLYDKLQPEPLLFQFAHMIAYLKVDWKDALRWCMENKNAIMIHAEVDLNEHENPEPAPEADGEADRDASLPPHKG